ncbi:proline racemase family protein [bacterium]|nr:proline racemase family protein [bacterium]
MNEFLKRLETLENWAIPLEWQKVTVIDAHTEGEPLRVIVSGFPDLSGKTILERRRTAKKDWDHLRTALMWEPRGHADMYGCILTPAVSSDADFGVLFAHNEGYSTMCGHGIIGVTTVVLETGLFEMRSPHTTIRIDTPAGLVTAHARIENDRVKSVRFQNVPSFVVGLDQQVEVPNIGIVQFDLAFGGAFYAYVLAEAVGLKCTPEHYRALIEKGIQIKRAVTDGFEMKHPFEKDLNFLYGTIFIDPPESKGSASRNVCIFAEGEVDRSPTGTGVSGRMAIHFARGDIALNEPMVIESIIGSQFTGRLVGTTRFGPYDAVIPEVEGRAFITGKNELLLDPNDPLRHGFFLR